MFSQYVVKAQKHEQRWIPRCLVRTSLATWIFHSKQVISWLYPDSQRLHVSYIPYSEMEESCVYEIRISTAPSLHEEEIYSYKCDCFQWTFLVHHSPVFESFSWSYSGSRDTCPLSTTLQWYPPCALFEQTAYYGHHLRLFSYLSFCRLVLRYIPNTLLCNTIRYVISWIGLSLLSPMPSLYCVSKTFVIFANPEDFLQFGFKHMPENKSWGISSVCKTWYACVALIISYSIKQICCTIVEHSTISRNKISVLLYLDLYTT